jgi:hypothetical protein
MAHPVENTALDALADDLFGDGGCDEREACAILGGISRATLYRERAAGRIHATKLGRRTVWSRRSLRRRLAEGLQLGPQG